MKKIAIIGSHGLYANYGGWDQLVNNLAEKKSSDNELIIFNSSDSPRDFIVPKNVTVKRLWLKASGFQGIFFDFLSILISFKKVDTILLLGVQGIPLLLPLRLFKKIKIISNVGGVEWERPKFSFFAKYYLKFCFNLSMNYSQTVILDNKYYKKFLPDKYKSNVMIIPYGGIIDKSLKITRKIELKYPFIINEYFLSISRALEDNYLDKICDVFSKTNLNLVLISNFYSSDYGTKVFNKYNKSSNLTLINGLYNKAELDLIRRKCKAYIHTHSLCGTAPSLVEMIVANKPILSLDIPQNRFTLNNTGYFFSDFSEIITKINATNNFSEMKPPEKLSNAYEWSKIIKKYESLY